MLAQRINVSLQFREEVIHSSSSYAHEPVYQHLFYPARRKRATQSEHALTFSQTTFVSVTLSPLFVFWGLLCDAEPGPPSISLAVLPAAPRCWSGIRGTLPVRGGTVCGGLRQERSSLLRVTLLVSISGVASGRQPALGFTVSGVLVTEGDSKSI